MPIEIDTSRYVQDARGRLIPESRVKPIDLLRDQTVMRIIERGKALATQLAEFKADSFADVNTFVDVSLAEYQVKTRGTKGNLTLMTFDGRYKIVRQIAEHIQFDERLQAAKELIDTCLRRWTLDSDDKVKALINDAFQVDKEGRISTSRVLGLRRIHIEDEDWTRAMNAIADSIRVTGTKPYIRLYERVGDTEEYRAISLDLASV